MFTGLIEKVGTFDSRKRDGKLQQCRFTVPEMWTDIVMGESIAVNGVCLTVTGIHANGFSADVSEPTLKNTSLGLLKKAETVNVERALKLGDRFGGHMVQGHIDGVGTLKAIRKTGENLYLKITAPVTIMNHLVEKGSVAIDGVSLTIQTLARDSFEVVIIPHAFQHTRFKHIRAGSPVNLECDIIGKYVKKFSNQSSGLNVDYLKEQGY